LGSWEATEFGIGNAKGVKGEVGGLRLFCFSAIVHRPDEINATEISSRLNRLRPREISTTAISRGKRLTGQVGQAEIAPVKWSSNLTGQAKIAEKVIIQLNR
jgi:hypothetical protein